MAVRLISQTSNQLSSHFLVQQKKHRDGTMTHRIGNTNINVMSSNLSLFGMFEVCNKCYDIFNNCKPISMYVCT